MRLYVNGRALDRHLGGVRRYAAEVTSHLGDATVLKPRRQAAGPLSGRVWEQTSLPKLSGDGTLLSMSHSGPLQHRQHAVVVHDLFALTRPRDASLAFRTLYRYQLPRLIRSAAQVIAVSHSVADDLHRILDIAMPTISVAQPGVSAVFGSVTREQARSSLGIEPERLVIGALSSGERRKRADATVDLIGSIAEAFPHVIAIAGGATAPKAVHGRSATRPARQAVTEFGALSDIDLASFYAACDIFVSLSAAEGWGLPVAEASASGAVVVSTRCPSLTEIAAAPSVIVETASQARSALEQLISTPQWLSELAQAGAQFRWPGWDRTAGMLHDVIGPTRMML